MNTKDQFERYTKEDLSSDQLEMYIQEDKEIRDLLIKESVIDDYRISRCCKFSNSERNNTPTKLVRSYPTYCERFECRFCRRKIIDRQRKNHYRNNIEFLETNDRSSILMFTLTVPHTKKDTLSSIHDRFKKSMTNMKHSRSWKKIKEMTTTNSITVIMNSQKLVILDTIFIITSFMESSRVMYHYQRLKMYFMTRGNLRR